ncbi:hypothetical protein JXA84_04030 [candidate division WOR-3 bacterium]|nr:hypothetical protein [candidate division WOR-3 bacterium]
MFEYFKTKDECLYDTEIVFWDCEDILDCIKKKIFWVKDNIKSARNTIHMISSFGFKTIVDEDQGKIFIFSPQEYKAKALRVSVGFFCWKMFPKDKYLFFHAASCKFSENSYLFPANSGKGKTTLSENAIKCGEVFNDEFSLVEITTDGYVLHGTPFGQVTSGPILGQLKKIFFLEKSEKNDFKRITPVESMKIAWEDNLYRTGITNSEERKLVFNEILDIFENIPCFEMNVRKDFNDFKLLENL